MGVKMETMADFIFLGSKITIDGDWIIMVIVAMKLKDTYFLGEKLSQHIKRQRHHFTNKGLSKL